MTSPAPRPTREQVDATPHKAAALLLAAARPDPTLPEAAKQVQDALIRQDAEVRALHAERRTAREVVLVWREQRQHPTATWEPVGDVLAAALDDMTAALTPEEAEHG